MRSNALDLDRRVREIFAQATRETVFYSTAALVDLGFGGAQSFNMVMRVLDAKERERPDPPVKGKP